MQCTNILQHSVHFSSPGGVRFVAADQEVPAGGVHRRVPVPPCTGVAAVHSRHAEGGRQLYGGADLTLHAAAQVRVYPTQSLSPFYP